MHSIEITELNKTLSFPENGTEFSTSQFLSFSRLMMLFNAKRISFIDLKTQLVYEFLNMVRSADLKKPENNQVSENVMYITQLVDPYFYDEKVNTEKVKALHMNFYTQLLPKLTVNGNHYYGPSDALFNTKYGEYMQALNAFIDYSHSGEEAELDRMIATLYRPKKENNSITNINYSADVRQKFNPEITNHFAEELKYLKPEEKYAVYLFFASCQHFISNSTSLPIGGGNSADLSVLYQKTSSNSSAKGLGMISTFFAIAESKVFGNTDDLSNKNTYDVLVYLVDQHLKMEAHNRKNKKK